MLVDKEGLWYRVLHARYGEEGGRLLDGGENMSARWRMMCGIRSGVGMGVGNWFEDNVRWTVGGGGTTYIWLDNRVGGAPLRMQFPHLFHLAENKGATVREMARRGWGVGGGTWEWQRRLLGWEEDSVVECSSLLCNVVLQDSIVGRWRWILDPISGYTIKGTYQYLTMFDIPLETSHFDAA